MPLPRPEIGLIVHYGFVSSGPDRGPPPDAGKDRPCLIVDLLPEEILGRKTLRVTYLLCRFRTRSLEKVRVRSCSNPRLQTILG